MDSFLLTSLNHLLKLFKYMFQVIFCKYLLPISKSYLLLLISIPNLKVPVFDDMYQRLDNHANLKCPRQFANWLFLVSFFSGNHYTDTLKESCYCDMANEGMVGLLHLLGNNHQIWLKFRNSLRTYACLYEDPLDLFTNDSSLKGYHHQ